MISFFKKPEAVINIDEQIHREIKKHILKTRTINAIKNTTNWQIRLVNFLQNNQNNQKLIIDVVGYRYYLISQGLSEEDAAKECLEYYQH